MMIRGQTHMRTLFLATCATLMIANQSFAAPLGNSFTYQGQLIKSSTPYAGNADFVFRLWNAATGGTQVGSSFSIAALPVTSGLFTAELDFGAAFDGTALWLDVQVKTPGEPSYTLLTPRVKLTAAPYALRALSAPGGGGLTLPYASSVNSPSQSAFQIQNTASGGTVHGLAGMTSSTDPDAAGVFGDAVAGSGFMSGVHATGARACTA
jgi:hypothetical protein